MRIICIENITKIPYGQPGLELLALSMNCIPFAPPVKFSNQDLVNLLAKYLIHADPGNELSNGNHQVKERIRSFLQFIHLMNRRMVNIK